MPYKKSTLSLFVSFVLSASLAMAQETVLGRFDGADGGLPGGALIADAAGNLYGASGVGLGESQDGLIYELVAPSAPGDSWTMVVLYRFPKGTESWPASPLTFDAAGNLYGVATYGGSGNGGAVFELSPPAEPGGAWTEATLYSFQGGNDGHTPNSGLVFDTAGNLYGSTYYGGACDEGTVYKLSPPTSGSNWTETLLHTFTAYCKGQNQNDGGIPTGGLLLAKNGTLYGVAYGGGGEFNGGTVFAIEPPAAGGTAWTEHVLYDFVDNTAPEKPMGTLVLDGKGHFYGTAAFGGNQACYNGIQGCGGVFELTPPTDGNGWTLNAIYSFTGGNDGADPYAGVVLDAHGNLYGTAYYGGNTSGNCPDQLAAAGCGTVFQLVPPVSGSNIWTENTLYAFTGSTDGATPNAAVLLGKGGTKLYGTAAYGGDLSCSIYGSIGCGVIFELRP